MEESSPIEAWKRKQGLKKCPDLRFTGKTAAVGLVLLWWIGCGGTAPEEHGWWNDRFTEGRLSGDIDWQPCLPHSREPSNDPGPGRPCATELRAKLRAGWFQEGLEASKKGLGQEQLLARAQLLQGGHRVRFAAVSLTSRVDSLSSAEDSTLRVEAMNDLAVALLEQSHVSGALLDTLRALEWIERALEENPVHQPALFNRALILEHAHLVLTAQDAWERYLEVDGSSGWADEARKRWADLKLEPDRSVHGPPQGRHHQLLEGLTEIWAQTEASEIQQHIDGLIQSGEADLDDAYDQSVVHSLLALENQEHGSAPGGSPVDISTLRVFAEGYKTYMARNYLVAEPLLRKSLPALSDLPLGSWIRTWLGFIHISNIDYDRAHRLIDEVLGSDHVAQYPSLSATAHWARALGLARQNHLRSSLSSYLVAADLFQQAGEPALSGNMEGQIADVLKVLGDDGESWEHRHRALSFFRPFPNFHLRHNALWESAHGALTRRLGRAALAFNTEGVRIAALSGTPLAKSEAHLRRARTLIELGREQEAVADLQPAREMNSKIADPSRRQRSAASISFSTALALTESQPDRAIQLLTDIVDYSASKDELRWLEALRRRAFLHRREGDPEAAERDLTIALEAVEKTLDRLDPIRRRPYLDAAQDLFEAKLDLYLEERRDREALGILERARALHWSGSLGEPATRDPLHWLPPEAVPAKTRVVAFAWIRDNIHIWLIDRRGIRWIGSRSAQGLDSRIEWLLEAVDLKMDTHRFADLTAELYEVLIQPLAGHLQENDRLIIAPDRTLSTLPFALLRNPQSGRYLIEERPLGFTPSLEVLRRAFLTGADIAEISSGLFLGDPTFDTERFKLDPLPRAAAEARQLAALYPGSQVLIGAEASSERLERQINRYPLLHFAGHAQRNDHYPERSKLVLAGEPGTLSVEQLAAAADGLTLVVLSACRTGTFDDRRAASVSGLAGALLASGVPAVVGTLWDLNDEAGRLLFTAFHGALISGEGYLEAAQRAQISLLSAPDGKWSHPRSWAGLQPLGYLSHAAEERNTVDER